MSFTFEIKADKVNKILLSRINGYVSSVEEYLKWEKAFEKAWREQFGDQAIKILADQRGFRATNPQIFERVKEYRLKKARNVIASATVVDDAIAQLQLQRLSAQSGLKTVEKFFIDADEALQWLISQ